MNLQASYFRVGNPLRALDRLFNPYVNKCSINVRGKAVCVEWTRRAEKVLQQRNLPLIVEMQLYFTCVVKKRVLFHENAGTIKQEIETISVNDKLIAGFRPVQSTSCDPVEFANNFPVKREFKTTAANSMGPSGLKIDFIEGEWVGEFVI